MGIGVNAPVHKLEVEGPRTSTYGTTIRVANSASSALAYQYGPAVLIETPNDGYGERRVSAVYFNRMRQNSEWCVGTEGGAFGSAPAYPAPSDDKFFISRTLKTTNVHQRVRPIYSNNTFFAINPDGTVGIGMTNPTYKLMLPNNTAITGGQARAYAWTTYSDGRLKTNRTPLSYGLDEIMMIEPLAYDHHSSKFLDANDDREKASIVISDSSAVQIGFIAQDLFKIVPEAVVQPENEEADLWAVDYTRLIPVLVKAMQEQQVIIEDLKAQVTTESENEAKIEVLEKQIQELKELILKSK
jgi:hypothetical protein